jgi:hypothetical protein
MKTFSCFAFVLLVSSFLPCLLQASEQTMEILVDRASVAFSGIPEATVNAMAKDNGFGPPTSWPVLKTTGHPDYQLPEGLVRRAKDHPQWQIKRLYDYRVAFQTIDDKHGKQRIVFLYRREANVLFILYIDVHYLDVPEKQE